MKYNFRLNEGKLFEIFFEILHKNNDHTILIYNFKFLSNRRFEIYLLIDSLNGMNNLTMEQKSNISLIPFENRDKVLIVTRYIPGDIYFSTCLSFEYAFQITFNVGIKMQIK